MSPTIELAVYNSDEKKHRRREQRVAYFGYSVRENSR
jgi:hypothetical protein